MPLYERLHYGASELRAFYNGHLFLALIVSVALHMAVIGFYVTEVGSAGANADRTDRSDTLIVLPTPRGMIEQPTEVTEVRRIHVKTPGCTIPMHVCIGIPPVVYVPYRIAPDRVIHAPNPIPKPDHLFESVYDRLPGATVRRSRAQADPLPEQGTMFDGAGVADKEREGNPMGEMAAIGSGLYSSSSDFYDPDVQFPDVDLDELASRIRYPAIARTTDYKGRVVVRALIDADGRTIRTQVVESLVPILDSAVLQAVRETRFQPATLPEGYPVSAWIYIPVNFTLD